MTVLTRNLVAAAAVAFNLAPTPLIAQPVRRLPSVKVEVRVASPVVAAAPVRIYAGLRNLGKADLAFVARPEGLEWITYSFSTISADGRGGVIGGVARGGERFKEGERFCPGPTGVLLLPPGSSILKSHELDLPSDLTGKISLEITVRLLEVDRNLACAPAKFFEATTTKSITIPARKPAP